MEARGQSDALVAMEMETGASSSSSGVSQETMLLSGHGGAVYSLAFDPTGARLASASYDRCILLWETEGECRNYNILKGHKNAVVQVKWCSDRSTILSCSADETVITWDANRGEMARKFVSHGGVVNSVDTAEGAPELFASGSDDKACLVWDARNNAGPVARFTEDLQVTAVALSADGGHVYTGGIDGAIRRYDVRKGTAEADLVLPGCSNIITGLALSPDGGRILANCMDAQLRSFDVRPFCARGENQRLEQTFQGVHHGAEKLLLKCGWSADGERITCGSADRNVHCWDATTGAQLALLGGHKASVNEVLFHPTRPGVVASCGSDKQIFLGPLGV